MTTTTLPLTNQAQAMLKELQRTAGTLGAQVDQALQAEAQKVQQTAGTQATQGTQTALDCDVLEKILLSAMPAQTQLIQRAKACGLKHHCDKTNGQFLSQILSMRIEKDTQVAYNPPPAVHRPIRVDPLYATFTMAPDASVMLLFNARNVDKNGQPLLMKVVARDSFDMKSLDLTKYRTDPNGTQPDVVRVKDSASYVETKDIDETEFSFGDPLKQVSLSKSGDEISTSVWVRPENINRTLVFRGMTGPAGSVVPNTAAPLPQFNRTETGDTIDTTPVATFDERIRVSLAAKSTLPAGTWLGTAGAGAHVDATLHVDRGLIFEPGATASVQLAGLATATINVAIDAKDAHLNGNASTSVAATLNPGATLRQILESTVNRASKSAGNDNSTVQKRLVDCVFADAASRTIGDKALAPLGDVRVDAATMSAMKIACNVKPLPGDPQKNGTKVSLTLDDQFLTAAKDTSFNGWKIAVGFTDEQGVWQEQARSVGGTNSKKESFTFDVTDFDAQQKKNANLEVRLFNADGVPAQRVLVPFREMHWGN
jgi:hypothetical protein